eukprot:gnl/TRDRNA2_/TRDRNA2_144788_c0_seq1.p1 gnl/TRDRNA2_/TRDRNA2_144788_c0~~gnl/TRDRNA2_/TRDRNA2_144788_c0_seq1.p1  ORF type:complete len:563 (+),score=71.13 gnl/TRDRNA2_/TRDRNA2_144788_c0_seq1:98-1690(+)
MARAGWQLRASDVEFKGRGAIFFWEGGVEIGSLTLPLPRASKGGLLKGRIRNVFPEKTSENFIGVEVNGVPLHKLGFGENAQLCVRLAPGDVFTIEEAYSQIMLDHLEFECDDDVFVQGETKGDARNRDLRCDVGTKVRVGWAGCGGKHEWHDGTVDEVLDEGYALVRFAEGGGRQRFAASQLALADQGSGSARCSDFEFERKRVGVMILADKTFQSKFQSQIQTHRCFTQRRGYDLWLLDGSEFKACRRYRDLGSFFFQKHCVVSEFLGTQAPGYVVAVVDADVVAVVLDRGLEEWARHDADVQFYERVTGEEIAAGNYIARNTPFARKFLMDWANWIDRRPKGYSSEDNGAIHLHVAKTMQLVGVERCEQMFASLVALSDNLNPYFDYVKCVKGLIGPPRRWQVSGGGVITVWPRLHFFVVDGVFTHHEAANSVGPVMHHGLKLKTDVKDFYFSNVDACELSEKYLESDQHFGFHVLRMARLYPHLYPPGAKCSQCVERCMRTLSCPPLGNDEAPVPQRTCSGKPDCR